MPSIPAEMASAVIDAEMAVLSGLSRPLLAGIGVLLLVTLAAICWLTLFDTAAPRRAFRMK